MKKLFLSSLFLLVCSTAWAVCDTTLSVCPSGCDYNVLNDAVTDLETNCSSPTGPMTVEISGTWSSADTTAVGISGITTSSTNNLTITTTGDARHDGRAKQTSGRSNHILSMACNNTWIVAIDSGYVTIDGLEIMCTSGSGYNYGIGSWNANKYQTIKNNIIHDIPSRGSAIYTLDRTRNVYNNIVYNIAETGISVGGGNDSNLYNNTVYNYNTAGISTRYGIQASTSGSIKNNLAVKGNSGGVDIATSPNTTSGSSDSSGSTATNLVDSDVFVSVSSGSYDFHLKSTATAIIDVGTSVSGTFTTDIDGTTRSGTWDIGADEYVSSGPSIHTTILRNAVIRNAVIR